MNLKDYIIDNIEQELIFNKYLNISLEDIKFSIINKAKIINSYRGESHPSMIFKYYGNKLICRDYGNSVYCGDVFEIVGNIINKNCRDKQGFIDICSDILLTCTKENSSTIIANEFEKKELLKKDTKLEYISRIPNITNYMFYEQFGINKEYFDKNITVVNRYYINDKLSSYRYSGSDPCYAYKVNPNKIKLYFPFRNKNNVRFITNNKIPIECFDSIINSDYKIIIKAIKDKILFERILNEKNINNIQVLSTSSETVNIPKEIYDILLNYTNKKIIYGVYDTDSVGIKSANKLKEELGIIPTYFTLDYNVKDPSDMVKKYGYTKVYNHFDEIFKNIL